MSTLITLLEQAHKPDAGFVFVDRREQGEYPIPLHKCLNALNARNQTAQHGDSKGDRVAIMLPDIH